MRGRTSQPDLPFEFQPLPLRRGLTHSALLSALQNRLTESALYSLTGLANFPVHAEPAHYTAHYTIEGPMSLTDEDKQWITTQLKRVETELETKIERVETSLLTAFH